MCSSTPALTPTPKATPTSVDSRTPAPTASPFPAASAHQTPLGTPPGTPLDTTPWQPGARSAAPPSSAPGAGLPGSGLPGSGLPGAGLPGAGGPRAVSSVAASPSAPADVPLKGVAGPFLSLVPGYEVTQGESAAGVPPNAGMPVGLYGPDRGSFSALVRQLTPTIATPFGGGAAWAVFALFGKKRRDDDEPDEGQLVAAAASAYEAEAARGLKPIDESTLPRWRRPSLQQVRRTDPLRAQQEEAPKMSFASAGVRPLENYERRTIGYRLVRLLDSPDELRAREIGIVDHGDEVQLLERHGAYWLVLCPDGRQGWLHRMTLADPPGAGRLDEPEPMPQYMDEYESPEVGAAQTEYAADPGTDGLLEAYMSARRDVLKTMADETAAVGDPTVPVLEFQGATFAAMPEQFSTALEHFVAPEAPAGAPAEAQAETLVQVAEIAELSAETPVQADDFAPALEAVLAFEVEAPLSSPLVVGPVAESAAEPPVVEQPSSEPPAAAPGHAG